MKLRTNRQINNSPTYNVLEKHTQLANILKSKLQKTWPYLFARFMQQRRGISPFLVCPNFNTPQDRRRLRKAQKSDFWEN